MVLLCKCTESLSAHQRLHFRTANRTCLPTGADSASISTESRDEMAKSFCGTGHDVWSAPVNDLTHVDQPWRSDQREADHGSQLREGGRTGLLRSRLRLQSRHQEILSRFPRRAFTNWTARPDNGSRFTGETGG